MITIKKHDSGLRFEFNIEQVFVGHDGDPVSNVDIASMDLQDFRRLLTDLLKQVDAQEALLDEDKQPPSYTAMAKEFRDIDEIPF